MDILLRVKFSETHAVELLNSLALHNAYSIVAMQEAGTPIPLLYESGVVYEREEVETWSDILYTIAAGKEDCDALAAARAGELVALGWRALTPVDGGYEAARRQRLDSIDAYVIVRTARPKGVSGGLYHCIVEYRIGDLVYRDDPSARLGMVPNSRENPTGNRPIARLNT